MERYHTKANASRAEHERFSPRAGWKRIVKKFGLFAALSVVVSIIFGIFGFVDNGKAAIDSVEQNKRFIELVKERLETSSQESEELHDNLTWVLHSTFVGYEELPNVEALMLNLEFREKTLSRKQYDALVPYILDYLTKTRDLKTGVYAYKALNSAAKIPIAFAPKGSLDLNGKVMNTYGDEFADFISRSTSKNAASLHSRAMNIQLFGDS